MAGKTNEGLIHRCY